MKRADVLIRREGEKEMVEVDGMKERRGVAQPIIGIELRLVEHEHACSLQRRLQLLPGKDRRPRRELTA